MRLPTDYSYEEGSTLPCAGLTGFDAPQSTLFPLVGKNAMMGASTLARGRRQFVRFPDATHIKPIIDHVFDFATAPAPAA